jgi:PTH1 family peptidyl-tRNA hydrolase
MKMFVGLGNPGEKYVRNRHNVGFMALDRIARTHNASPWRRRFHGEAAEAVIDGEKLLLLMPMTYMNLSGQAVGAAVQFYKIEPGDVTVFHDELDLAPGKIKIKTGGGHAGHNGLKSVTAHIGPGFRRVRIGIGRPGDRALVLPYVLGNFAKADEEWLEPLLEAMAQAAPLLAEGAEARFMNDVARRIRPETALETEQAETKSRPAAGKAPASSGKPGQQGGALADRLRDWLKGNGG